MQEDIRQNNKRILYVEDHKAFGETVSRLLGDYEVLLAPTIKEGLEKAKKDKFGLYLLDINLPDGTGVELCREIRTFDTETPVLFVTALTNLSEAEVSEAKAQGMLRKDKAEFVRDLLDRVSQLLNGGAPPESSPIK